MVIKKTHLLVALIVCAKIADVANSSPTSHQERSKAEGEAESRQVAGLDVSALLTLILESLERILQLIKLNDAGGTVGNTSWGGGGVTIG